MGDASTSRLRWELENNVLAVGGGAGGEDLLFKYDHAEQQVVQQQKPWTKDPHFFKQWVEEDFPDKRERERDREREDAERS